jgi:hypothetical protein
MWSVRPEKFAGEEGNRMIEQQNVSPAPAVEVSADLDGEVAVFGAASELTLAAVTRTPLHRRRLGQIRHAAERLGARLLVLALVGGDRAEDAPAEGAAEGVPG